MSTRHVAVAIIGAGSDVAGNHFAAFSSLDRVKVVAGVDIARPARSRVVHEWGVPAYPDVRGLVDARQRVDLAVVCVPDSEHASVGRGVLSAGWHALIEKPLASSYRQAARLFGIGERLGLYVAVGLQRRYMTARVRELCAKGTLGAVLEIHASWWAYAPMPEWRQRLRGRGRGGVLADRAVHLLSQADDLMGSRIPRRVTTRSVRRAGHVENSVLITVDYQGGPVVVISAAFDRAIQGDRAALHVVGGLGEIHSDLPTLEDEAGAEMLTRTLHLRTDNGPEERKLPRLLTVPECQIAQADHVVTAVRRGRPAPESEVRRELRLMSLVDAAYAAEQRSRRPRHVRRWGST